MPSQRHGSSEISDDKAQRMIQTIRSHALSASKGLGRDAIDPRVIDALQRVPRHRFVPEELADEAYDDRPLPIGHGQTISQPFMVAFMTDLLQVDKNSRVLEIGCGCGYQTAILAELVAQVHAIDIVPELADRALTILEELGYDNVRIKAGDGYSGWSDAAPFDAILVAAAATEIPPPLLDQLAASGRLVIPVGRTSASQYLVLATKHDDGEIATREVLPVRFVPLTGEH